MEQSELDKILTFAEAISKYDTKEITVGELSGVVQRLGVNVDFWKWNMATEPNPEYADGKEGSEGSRNYFKWNNFHNEKGKFYQSVIKRAILAAIDMAHKHTLERYNKNQFVYDDSRLKGIDKFAKGYINKNFQESGNYKTGFMNKIVDIALGTICKEDIYYRARFFDMANAFVKEYPNGFELDKIEKENVERWH
jgi:hypothetical protein